MTTLFRRLPPPEVIVDLRCALPIHRPAIAVIDGLLVAGIAAIILLLGFC
jgi:hypothetical protein